LALEGRGKWDEGRGKSRDQADSGEIWTGVKEIAFPSTLVPLPFTT